MLARVLARLVGILLLALIAVVGGLAAVFCIDGGTGALSLHQLAADVHLPAVRDHTHHLITQVTTPGPVAIIALVAGLAAVVLGLLADVQHRVGDGLAEHGLPLPAIDVTVTAVHQGDHIP